MAGFVVFFLSRTKSMAILLEIFQKGLSDSSSSPLRTTSIRSHPGEQERGCWMVKEGKVAGRIMEGSGSAARKMRRMSQGALQQSSSSRNSRNPHPHRTNNTLSPPVNREYARLPERPISDSLTVINCLVIFSPPSSVFSCTGGGCWLWMARSDEIPQLGRKRPADGDPDGAQPLTKRFGYLRIGKDLCFLGGKDLEGEFYYGLGKKESETDRIP